MTTLRLSCLSPIFVRRPLNAFNECEGLQKGTGLQPAGSSRSWRAFTHYSLDHMNLEFILFSSESDVTDVSDAIIAAAAVPSSLPSYSWDNLRRMKVGSLALVTTEVVASP
ncbi:hypothetical protein CLAIMM_10859 [Cladophialophora immunda]|nr:hypothetical protein CLAIMM_10859 [Cladophialophora immunda]